MYQLKFNFIEQYCCQISGVVGQKRPLSAKKTDAYDPYTVFDAHQPVGLACM